jgi:hypothetical protein
VATGAGRQLTPIQRLAEIRDPATHEAVAHGVQITLDANLAHLRSIKDTEHKWLDLLSIITLPAVGYLMAVEDCNAVWGWALLVVLGMYLVVTCWMQYVLLRERFSYYAVLRSVVRAQNLLGLFDVGFLSPHLAGSAFPRGFGPYPDREGTRPFSSFLRRQLYTLILFSGLLAAAAFRTPVQPGLFGTLALVCLAGDVAWLVYLFRRDRQSLEHATAQEVDLAGADPAWFGRQAA